MQTAQELWENAVCHLKQILHPDVFQRWISVLDPVSLDNEALTLGVDNDFYQTWLEEHYLPVIRDAVAATCGSTLKIRFCVQKKAQEQAQPRQEPVAQPKPVRAEPRQKHFSRQESSPLNEKFTFGDFIVGSCNSFAHAASLAVAQAPGRAYNPLFIYGGSGLGKTHLMQAIGQYVLKNSRAVVSYLSSEAFINEYINALESRSLVQFRKKYRHVDLLLIDDIHFLGGKERLQEEFFHTFNTLFDAHKQIVMTSDRSASEIVGLQQRLVSRFEWGLVTEMEPPDLETRIAILRHNLKHTNATLPDDDVLFIAENIKSNIRRLEGALVRVVSYSSLTGQPLTRPSMEHLLRDTISEEKQDAVTLSAIQKAVADYYDVRVTDFTGKRRPRSIALPRQVAMYLCRRFTEGSLPEIGNAFDKTHATVLYACRQIEQKLKTDESFRRNIHAIAKSFGKSL